MNYVSVGVLDSGVAHGMAAAARRFVAEGDGVVALPAGPDGIGHGTAIAKLILRAAPGVRLLSAQAFSERGVATPAAVAAGVAWLVAQGARVVNMSFGLLEDRAVLCRACRDAVEAGVVVVASVPAMGPQVFPAAYPGVVRVTGDGRCTGAQIAAVGSGRVDFGANPWPDEPGAARAPVAGASIAAARVTAALAAAFAADPAIPAGEALARLTAQATHQGPQRVPRHA